MPKTLSIAGLPVATEYSNSPNDCHIHGPAIIRTVDRAFPGWSERSASPFSVSVYVPLSVRSTIPMQPRERRMRSSERSWLFVFVASAGAVFVPAAMRSARPSLAATKSSRDTQCPVLISMTWTCGGGASCSWASDMEVSPLGSAESTSGVCCHFPHQRQGGGSMAAVKPVPEGFRTLTPHITVKGAKKAIAFYQQAFGAEQLAVHDMPDGTVMHASLRIGDSVLMLNDEFPQMGAKGPQSIGGTAVTLHLYVADVDKAFDRAVNAGAAVVMPVADQFWG